MDYSDRWPDMRMKHLDMLQAIVVRMNTCSQQCKVAAMAILSAIIGLATTTGNPEVALTAIPLVLLFAFLDAHYLTLERSFRSKFDEVRYTELLEAPDFDLSSIQDRSIWSAIISPSVLAFYVGMVAVVVAAFMFITQVVTTLV
ncbi:hypothetical protein [Pseudophaeobacter arcticus]|jgi:hypothetical protein|uniref:hypothetical protein n=1 Tax=Pseudophaeobacter arcticus TaxID=385492 RepID=UPI0039E4A493